MAGITIKMNLEDSGSIVKKTNDTKTLNKELEKTSRLASQALAQPKSAAFVAAETQEYGRGRAAVGTGAAARDFANQAQGLGGLVRLYATYAANLFAATAAFNALREAMNTDMMVRGLDQLGAASGVALGGLAKQFVQVTDGAISLRESMEATTKAISSGLSTAQFLELGKVAKGASQALGVNMSDAVSRLTRGITKLEPELLDELGIFTKVGQAAEQYAKSVGKSVTSLTDFERRQAFANAVLEEGRQKFGEIAMEGNPYDKLLANLKNVAQDILSVVNTVVAPIAKLLADNIGLIGLAIAAAGVKIVSQALPAIRSWQDGLKDAAQAAKARALEVSESFGAQWVLREEARQDIPRLKSVEVDQTKELEAIDRQRTKIASELDNRQIGYRENAKTLAILKTKEALTEQQINALLVQKTKLDSGTTERQKAQLAAIEARLALEKQSLAVQQAISATQQKIKSAYDIVGQKAEQESFDDVLRRRITEQATAEKARLDILSKVSDDVEKKGFRAAVGELYSETAASKDLNRFQKFRTAAVGTISAVTTQAGLILSAFSNVTAYLQIAVVGFTLLSSIFSKASKELSEFNTQIEAGEEAAKTATNTLEKYGSALTIQSINARATAFETLSSSIALTTKKAQEAVNAFSLFDTTINFFKAAAGFGIGDTFAASIGEQIVKQVELIPDEEIRKTLEEKLTKSLNIKVFNKENIEDALAATGGIRKIIDKSNELSAIINKSGRQLLETRALTQDIVANDKDFSEKLRELSKPKTDPFSDSLKSSLKVAEGLKKAFENTSAAALTVSNIISGKLAGSLSVLASGNEKVNEELLNFSRIDAQIAAANNRIENLTKQAAKDTVNIRLAEVSKSITSRGTNPVELERRFKETIAQQTVVSPQISRQVEIERAEVARLKADLEKSRQILERASIDAINVVKETIIKTTSAVQAGLTAKSRISAIEQLPVKTIESIEARRKAEIQLINAETASQIAAASQTTAVEQNTIALENLTDSLQIDRLRAQLSGKVTENQADSLLNRISELEKGIAKRSSVSQAFGNIKNQSQLDAMFRAGDIDESQYARQSNILIQNAQQQQRISEANRSAALQTTELVFDKLAKDNQEAQAGLTTGLSNLKTLIDTATEPAVIQGLIESQKVVNDALQRTKQEAVDIDRNKQAARTSIVGKNVPELIGPTMNELDRQAAKGKEALSSAQGQETFSAGVNAQKELQSLKDRFSLESQAFASREANIALQQQQIENARALGAITESDYLTRKNALEVSKINLDSDKETARLIKEQEQTRQMIAKIPRGALTEAELKELESLEESTNSYYASAIANAEKLAQARKAGVVELSDEQKRMANFASSIEKLFQGMGDAMADFVLTGKGNFKDLINSMLADLLRFEMRQNMMNLYKSLGSGKGIVDAILNIGSSSSIGGSSAAIKEISALPLDYQNFAHGAAFDEGLMRFARGGAFTNEVVNTPTQFKFAQGAGVMGEAGPEAIMPLARDSSGNLGVRANGGGGGNVEVVVNNYTTEKAEARETVDSRGNRRIEVVVGELVAGEITRPNSAVNRSIRTTFGTPQALIRR